MVPRVRSREHLRGCMCPEAEAWWTQARASDMTPISWIRRPMDLRVRILVWSLATSLQAPKVLAMSGEQPDLRRGPLRSLRHIASRIVAAVLACPAPCSGAGEGPSPSRDAGNRSDRPPCQCGAARTGIVRLGHGRAV